MLCNPMFHWCSDKSYQGSRKECGTWVCHKPEWSRLLRLHQFSLWLVHIVHLRSYLCLEHFHRRHKQNFDTTAKYKGINAQTKQFTEDNVLGSITMTTNLIFLCYQTDPKEKNPYVSRYALESPVPLADLIALSPGYRVLPDLATVSYAPSAYAVCAPGGRNVGSNVWNDVAGSVT